MEILENSSMDNFTTFKIGGKVRYLFKPANIQNIISAIHFLKKRNLPYFVLGEGSNVLIGSKNFEGGVISMLNLNNISLLETHDNNYQIKAEGGLINSNLSLFACEKSIKDFEFLYYMPGSVGGSTVMNARAFGGSMSDVVSKVSVIDSSLNLVTFDLSEIGFGYKRSLFQNENYIITEVLFKAEKGNFDKIKEKMSSNKEIRLSNNQHLYPSAGCIFKNDYNIGIPTGKIIEELDLKGLKRGGAEVFEDHGNFIINKGNATSDDVKWLIDMVKKKVKKEKKIDLKCEIRFYGNF